MSAANVDARDFERRRMAAFTDLPDEERRRAIRSMAKDRVSVFVIASATGLSIEAIAAVLAEPEAGNAA